MTRFKPWRTLGRSVLGIVQSHRAALNVRTELGRGTCFEIAWPSVPTPARDSVSPPRSQPLAATGRALVIDDDDDVRHVVAEQLASFGFEVETMRTGIDGLERIQRAFPPISLVLLDRTMPGLSGDEVLSAIRRSDPRLPVVLMSGYADDSTPRFEHVAFLPKPMTLADLQRAIERAMGTGETEAPSDGELPAQIRPGERLG
jgi:CheY-like chemotaxis protein